MSFAQLRRHWAENAARERANPPANRPSIEQMRERGRDMAEAPTKGDVWIMETTGEHVFRARQEWGGWLLEDAGDLWPTKPVKWLPIEG